MYTKDQLLSKLKSDVYYYDSESRSFKVLDLSKLLPKSESSKNIHGNRQREPLRDIFNKSFRQYENLPRFNSDKIFSYLEINPGRRFNNIEITKDPPGTTKIKNEYLPLIDKDDNAGKNTSSTSKYTLRLNFTQEIDNPRKARPSSMEEIDFNPFDAKRRLPNTKYTPRKSNKDYDIPGQKLKHKVSILGIYKSLSKLFDRGPFLKNLSSGKCSLKYSQRERVKRSVYFDGTDYRNLKNLELPKALSVESFAEILQFLKDIPKEEKVRDSATPKDWKTSVDDFDTKKDFTFESTPLVYTVSNNPCICRKEPPRSICPCPCCTKFEESKQMDVQSDPHDKDTQIISIPSQETFAKVENYKVESAPPTKTSRCVQHPPETNCCRTCSCKDVQCEKVKDAATPPDADVAPLRGISTKSLNLTMSPPNSKISVRSEKSQASQTRFKGKSISDTQTKKKRSSISEDSQTSYELMAQKSDISHRSEGGQRAKDDALADFEACTCGPEAVEDAAVMKVSKTVETVPINLSWTKPPSKLSFKLQKEIIADEDEVTSMMGDIIKSFDRLCNQHQKNVEKMLGELHAQAKDINNLKGMVVALRNHKLAPADLKHHLDTLSNRSTSGIIAGEEIVQKKGAGKLETIPHGFSELDLADYGSADYAAIGVGRCLVTPNYLSKEPETNLIANRSLDLNELLDELASITKLPPMNVEDGNREPFLKCIYTSSLVDSLTSLTQILDEDGDNPRLGFGNKKKGHEICLGPDEPIKTITVGDTNEKAQKHGCFRRLFSSKSKDRPVKKTNNRGRKKVPN